MYTPGIQGYSPKGNIGDTGAPGYSLYYTPHAMKNDENVIDELIEQGKLLSDTDSSSGLITYNEHDIIIDKFAKMYIISPNTDESSNQKYKYVHIGNIINQSKNENIGTELSIPNEIAIRIKTENHTTNNTYTDINTNSPLHRHALENKQLKGFLLSFNDTLQNYITNDQKNIFKFVILHKSGLSQEWIIDKTAEDPSFFVEFRHLQMTMESEQPDNTQTLQITSELSELINEKCSFYIDIEVLNYGTYRKKIRVENE